MTGRVEQAQKHSLKEVLGSKRIQSTPPMLPFSHSEAAARRKALGFRGQRYRDVRDDVGRAIQSWERGDAPRVTAAAWLQR